MSSFTNRIMTVPADPNDIKQADKSTLDAKSSFQITIQSYGFRWSRTPLIIKIIVSIIITIATLWALSSFHKRNSCSKLSAPISITLEENPALVLASNVQQDAFVMGAMLSGRCSTYQFVRQVDGKSTTAAELAENIVQIGESISVFLQGIQERLSRALILNDYDSLSASLLEAGSQAFYLQNALRKIAEEDLTSNLFSKPDGDYTIILSSTNKILEQLRTEQFWNIFSHIVRVMSFSTSTTSLAETARREVSSIVIEHGCLQALRHYSGCGRVLFTEIQELKSRFEQLHSYVAENVANGSKKGLRWHGSGPRSEVDVQKLRENALRVGLILNLELLEALR